MRRTRTSGLLFGTALLLSSAVASVIAFKVTLSFFTNSNQISNLARRKTSFNFQQAGHDRSLLKSGWSSPEIWGVWSDAPEASIQLPIPARVQQGIFVHLVAQGFIIAPDHASQRVTFSIDGRVVAELSVNRPTLSDYYFEIPAGVYKAGALNTIAFSLPDALSPASLSINSDKRQLALGLQQIELEYAVSEIYDNE